VVAAFACLGIIPADGFLEPLVPWSKGAFIFRSPHFFFQKPTLKGTAAGTQQDSQPASKQAREAGREGASIIQPEIYTLNLNKP